MTKAPNHRITPEIISGGFRARTFAFYLAFLLFPALAGSAFAGSERHGQLVELTYKDGDIFVGFRATDRTSEYLINIGQPTQFLNSSSGETVRVNVGTLSADLDATFGSDWYTRIDSKTGTTAIFWSVTGGRQIAGSGDPANTLYSTNSVAKPWEVHSDTAQSFTTSLIAGLGKAFAGNQSSPNNEKGLIRNVTGSNSYASFQPGGPNSSGISFQTWNPANETGPAHTLYFNRLAPGSSARVLGTLTLSSTGVLTFTARGAENANDRASDGLITSEHEVATLGTISRNRH